MAKAKKMIEKNMTVAYTQIMVGVRIHVKVGSTTITGKVFTSMHLSSKDVPVLEIIDWEIEHINHNGHDIVSYSKIAKYIKFHQEMGIDYDGDMQTRVDALSLDDVINLSGISLNHLV